MNIFVLDRDPILAARMQCNKHVVKMVLETAQMLCASFPEGEAPYLRAHYNHPCTIWARTSKDNFQWLLTHGKELAKEYTRRYDKIHSSHKVIAWCADNIDKLDFPEEGLTEFAVAISDDQNCRMMVGGFDSLDFVDKYRMYYILDKSRFAKWPGDRFPDWYLEGLDEFRLR